MNLRLKLEIRITVDILLINNAACVVFQVNQNLVFRHTCYSSGQDISFFYTLKGSFQLFGIVFHGFYAGFRLWLWLCCLCLCWHCFCWC